MTHHTASLQATSRTGTTWSERATWQALRAESVLRRVAQRAESGPLAVRWVWVVLIGILVIAAAVAFVWCQRKGYHGFNGRIEAVKGPLGIKIGVKIGCY